MGTRIGLVSICLAGFQVFDEPVEIPIGRLTFLFGPNSAGKSAVEDALVLYEKLLLPECPIHNSAWGRAGELRKYWRRFSDEPFRLADRMSIGATVSVDVSLHRVIAENLNRPSTVPSFPESSPLPHQISVIYSFALIPPSDDDEGNWREEEDPAIARTIEVHLDGVPLTRYVEWDSLHVNVEHPVLHGLIDTPELMAARHTSPDYLSSGDGWLVLKGGGMDFFLERGRAFNLEMFHHSWEEKFQERMPDALARAASELKQIYDTIQEVLLVYVTQEIHTSVVSASRRIPLDHELVYLLEPESYYGRRSVSLDGFNLTQNGSDVFWSLAASCRSYLAIKNRKIDDSDGENTDYIGDARYGKAFENINRSLTDHLFLERGYRIAFDYRTILDPEALSDAYDIMEDERSPTEFPMFLRIFLEDAERRRYSFTDVGSGLGYVLPVLVALWKPYDGYVLLQQPELHLHPALQASLGDVFIEATSESIDISRSLVVESHSEHLLLRVLKRIRQTSSGALLDQSLRISPTEVPVIYFDPRADGSTAVKRLRISEEGDFLDRWPRGFFAERDQELFDE